MQLQTLIYQRLQMILDTHYLSTNVCLCVLQSHLSEINQRSGTCWRCVFSTNLWTCELVEQLNFNHRRDHIKLTEENQLPTNNFKRNNWHWHQWTWKRSIHSVILQWNYVTIWIELRCHQCRQTSHPMEIWASKKVPWFSMWMERRYVHWLMCKVSTNFH